MKCSVFSATVIAIVTCTFGPASTNSMSGLGVDMSVITTMIDGMADSPQKWQMYRHVVTINAARPSDDTRGCDTVIMDIASGTNIDDEVRHVKLAVLYGARQVLAGQTEES